MYAVVIGDAHMGTLQVFNESLILIRTLNAHNGTITRLKQLLNGNLASSSADFTVKIWRTTDWSVNRTYSNHTNIVYALESIDNTTIASGSADKTIHIWDTNTGNTKLILNASSEVTCLQLLSASRTFLLSGQADGSLKVWDLTTGQSDSERRNHSDRVTDLVLINDELIASASWDKKILIWNTTSRNVMYTLTGHTGKVTSLKVLSSTLIASGSTDNTSKIWDLDVQNSAFTFKNHTNFIMSSVDLFTDGILVTGSLYRTIKFWDQSTGDLCESMNVSMHVNALIMLGSGEYILGIEET